MDLVKGVIQAILGAREKASTGTRWPMQTVIIETSDENTINATKELFELIKTQTNIKEIEIESKFTKAKTIVKPNYKALGPDFGKDSQLIAKELNENNYFGKIKNSKIKVLKFNLDEKHYTLEKTVPDNYKHGEFPKGNVFLCTDVSDELISEGYVREVVRRIQNSRKEAGLHKSDEIELYLKLDKELFEHIKPNASEIKERVGAKKIEVSVKSPTKKFKFSNKEEIKGLEIESSFEKI